MNEPLRNITDQIWPSNELKLTDQLAKYIIMNEMYKVIVVYKTGICLFFFVTGCTVCCQNDKFQCTQWWKFRKNYISFQWTCTTHFLGCTVCILANWGPFLTLIPACISNYTHYKVCDKITYPFPNFNGCTEVWEWISNLIPYFTEHVIIYFCWDWS